MGGHNKQALRTEAIPHASHRGPGVVLGVAVGFDSGAVVGLAVHGHLHVFDQDPKGRS